MPPFSYNQLISEGFTNGMSGTTKQQWSESAYYWEKHRETIRTMFAPISQALVEVAMITPGQFVLDIGAGPGEPSLTIAKAFGPSTQVICTDPDHGMVGAAMRETERNGLLNVMCCQCVGEELPFRSGRFDRSICRLGAMFFERPVQGLKEMLRVLRDEGRVAFAVWCRPEKNPLFHVVSDCVARYVPPVPEKEDAPGAFRYSRSGKLAALLEQAGAREVHERSLEFQIEAPVTANAFWTLRSEMSDTLRDKLSLLGSIEKTRLASEVEEAVRPYFATGRMSFPAQVLLITGAKN